NGRLENALSDAKQRLQQQLAEETRINRKLVGLKGEMKRVAILFDASGSMQQSVAENGRNRWAEAQEIAATWLQHLDVDFCALVVFSTDVKTFPEDGALADLRGPDGDAKRADLLRQLRSVSPSGSTNTLAALETAYGYERIDAILLFSDGAPTNDQSGRIDPQIAQRIYDLCQVHKDVPINSIGLGNYFDKDMATFLRSVAEITNGAFRGH
ncbi:MAG: vWA domain-containing protein, partial [Planctomycetota bacterium]